MATLSTLQIGKAGELLVQLTLLRSGFDSSLLTTDTGVDLVAYSARDKKVATIQVKTNLAPKPQGGKGKSAFDWWIPKDNKSDVVALVDLSDNRIWVMTNKEVADNAQQHPKDHHHLYMYDHPDYRPRKDRKCRLKDFEEFLLEKRLDRLFRMARD